MHPRHIASLLMCRQVGGGHGWKTAVLWPSQTTAGSDEGEDRHRISDWRVRVLAADAKKTEGASEAMRWIPSPPALTGRLAWVDWMSDKSELVMKQRPLRRSLSNWTRSSLLLLLLLLYCYYHYYYYYNYYYYIVIIIIIIFYYYYYLFNKINTVKI